MRGGGGKTKGTPCIRNVPPWEWDSPGCQSAKTSRGELEDKGSRLSPNPISTLLGKAAVITVGALSA